MPGKFRNIIKAKERVDKAWFNFAAMAIDEGYGA
jgi:hypothetical protein